MVNSDEELVIARFQDTYPEFAGRSVTRCKPGADPPDFVCIDQDSKKIGIELVSWLDQESMTRSTQSNRLEMSFLECIRSDREQPAKNLGTVFLDVRPEVRNLKTADKDDFRRQLYECIRSHDSNYDRRKERRIDVADYPYVTKYLTGLRFRPQLSVKEGNQIHWIRFEDSGGPYSEETGKKALRANIGKKVGKKYADLHRKENLAELYLLIHYDLAYHHNQVFETPWFDFDQAADCASRILKGVVHDFQRVFLFCSLKRRYRQVWPLS